MCSWALHENMKTVPVPSPRKTIFYPRVAGKLVDLPEDYMDLINSVSSFTCPNNDSCLESRTPTMCLICGTVCCSQVHHVSFHKLRSSWTKMFIYLVETNSFTTFIRAIVAKEKWRVWQWVPALTTHTFVGVGLGFSYVFVTAKSFTWAGEWKVKVTVVFSQSMNP